MSLYLWFALIVIASSIWIIWFLYRPLKSNDINLEGSNIALGKQKLLELEQDLHQNLIDEKQFNQAKEEISTTLAIELQQVSNIQNNASNNTWVLILILVLLPVVSIGVYQYLTPRSNMSQPLESAEKPLSLEQSANKIVQYLQTNEDDSEAWKMLGLTYLELGKLDLSIEAYEKSYQINPEDPRLLVEYASMMISASDNQFSDKSVKLIKQALEIEPNAPDALYLAGMFAVSQQDFNLAKGLWQRALNALLEGSIDRVALVNILSELKAVEVSKDTPEHSISVRVDVSNEVLKSRSSEDFIMIYVKAAKGRPMPIAIKKIKLKDFTGQVVLTDQDSVIQGNQLSRHDQVIAVVRISATGSAMRGVGDIQVLSKVINVADNSTVHLSVK
ncbi:cytochrome c-type biogenesis protein CcmH [Isorropodon fossajaponicum endosymbiont JTNG4]|uniref:c-type cytochrome biogenesis protein CcmI n=1 Tax=Isorropodon fossajaponicum symbiont TaxID=883811 RepID=UPI001915D5C9|nr:c-type cytochrome biogenesis protein CcmI [Isorropodon fossajaponicum symbiont]BBB24111.1 cytochrome c-type biogenesis protein CcmH [Isorropodon fossajaponicum endosymbiont JTNG4]